jgi:hypothetical protein
MRFSCHRMRIHLAHVKFAVKLEPFFFPLSDFLRQDGRPRHKVASTYPRPPTRYRPIRALPQQRGVPARGSKQETLLQASIASFLVLSWNRTPLKSHKFAFHETRRVPCRSRETVPTIKQVKYCKEKHPKTKLCNQLARNHRHQQRQCGQTLAQFPFVSKSSVGSVHIACHSAAGATLVTTSKFLATLISLLGSSWDQ